LALFDKCRKFTRARELMAEQLYPYFQPIADSSCSEVVIHGHRLVMIGSNNYLGLTHHPRVVSAAEQSLRADGLGSGAAPLITGYTHRHAAAESTLAQWKGAEDAVLLPSGYQANHAAVQTLAALGQRRGGTRFLIDKLAHASLLDAVRGTSAAFRVFPHNHLPKLQRLLADAPQDQLQVVITESIFSMDGDAADLVGLAALKARYPFILLLDEAHGSGVYGPNGAGYAAEHGMQSTVDVTVLTLSKSLGAAGGAVCASRNFCAALVNYGRAFIYSTAIPPMIAAAIQEAVAVLRDEPERRRGVRGWGRRVREVLRMLGARIPAGDSPIVPIIFGDEGRALLASRTLLEGGMLVPAVRPPTVPRGSSRLRLTLSCDHTEAEIQRMLDIVTGVIRQLGEDDKVPAR
jgi:8-amino-7-oxononanoate synthase